MSFDIHTQPLSKLTQNFFESMGFITLHPALALNNPLADSRLSYVLKSLNKSENGYIGVIVRDWKRVVGVGQVHKAEELLERLNPELTKILIVSSMGFSYSATRLADKIGRVGLLSRGQLISLLLKRIEVL